MRLSVSSHPVVFAADDDETVDAGAAGVAVPYFDVVGVRGGAQGTALEASAVPDGYGEALGCVGEALLVAQPEGTAGPIEDHPGQIGVGVSVSRISRVRVRPRSS